MKNTFAYFALAAAALATAPALEAQPSWSQPVREVEKPHQNPYQEAVGVNFGYSCSNCESKTFPALPANKRLVVEHIAVQVMVPENGEYNCRIGPSGGPFLPLEAPRRSNRQAIISQPVRLYLDKPPLLTCTRSEASSTQWGGVAFVSGYLVDKP